MVEDLRKVLSDVFQNSEIPENIESLKIGDFPEWDSLGNFNLLLVIEELYSTRLTIEQMSQIKSVQQILAL
jgi:acyl carrier protein